jgi:hypothetical protein
MSRQAGSIVSGDFKAAPDIRMAGRQQVAGMYCARGERSRWAGNGGLRTGGGRNGYPKAKNLFDKTWLQKCQGLMLGLVAGRGKFYKVSPNQWFEA